MEHQPPNRDSRQREALSDTIVAAATAAGRGAVAIVRVSGPQTGSIARAMLGALPPPRLATVAAFRGADGQAIDHGLALYFPAPQSYTGEDLLELQGHGGPVVPEALLARALELGARRAQPGEFTQRAYLNGKLDLAQAEAVADLIDAASGAAARAALRSLQGEFSSRVLALNATLEELRVCVEAAIDFADEEIDVLSDQALQRRLESAAAQLQQLKAQSRQGRLLTEGMTIVIAGRPNAGKSTLLNRLAGHDAAIVTPLPGTTRDLLRERILLDGMPLHVLDTAGLREPGDPIEAEGIRRARGAMERADRILFVLDAAADPALAGYLEERPRLPAQVPVTLVLNKVDLLDVAGAAVLAGVQGRCGASAVCRLSALTGEGLEALSAHLRSSAGFEPAEGATVSARARHVEALGRAEAHLAEAARQLAGRDARELIAEELRRAREALGDIVGAQSSDELLGRIFASFCIGK